VTVPSPVQDSERQAQSQARQRLLKLRSAGGVTVFSAMAVLGVVGLATGHEVSGLIALAIGAPVVIVVVARLAGHR
jgi:hypothetical protein